MTYFEGVRCPYCKKNIKAGDDVAVCPVCGTPHHRACFKEHGVCFNEAKHESGYEWKRRVTAAKDTSGSIVCEHCGRVNAVGTEVCSGCGRPLLKKALSSPGAVSTFEDSASSSVPAKTSDEGAFLSANVDTTRIYADEDVIDDISVKDWKTYIGTGIPYYLYSFKLQDRLNRRATFTWSAAMFPTLYLLYRKLWLEAACSMLISAVCSIPSVVLMFFPSGAVLGLSDGFWNVASSVCSAVLIVAKVCWGLFAVWLYRKKGSAKIKAVHSSCATQSEYTHRLQRVGGPSYLAVLVTLGALMALSFALVSLFPSISEIITQGVML